MGGGARNRSYPAPFVSTIFAGSIFQTGKVSVADCPPTATMVGSVPWVMTTTRGLAVFFLGRSASAFAMSEISVAYIYTRYISLHLTSGDTSR